MSDVKKFYNQENWRMEDSVGYLVKRLSMVVTRELDRRMDALGLTDAQWKPLVVLQQGAGKTAADIARNGCHDTGAVTRLLDRLESKELIRRVRSEDDRRVMNLELTDEGRQVAEDVPKIIANLANQVLDGFSETEFRQFQDYLRRALTNAQALEQGENG
ncbi:MAG TPA: MarR family transcriptional regulator [Rhodocyclaceae bacterium]|jgi:DNA-binding MarR family transcriptional regulator|nr:MarR family transcriptional regulator [Rhodocyclaceae bacterium]